LFGFFAGLSGIVGHELVHRKESHNKHLGVLLYTKAFYSHFLDEHIKGHHKHVSTPNDTTSAPQYQTLYEFWVQSIVGSHRCVWDIETRRIKRKLGKNVATSLLIFNNKMSAYFCVHATIVFVIYMTLGWSSVKYQFAYALTEILFLETVNYLEHYGLQRKKDEHDIYESINKMHSWNAKSGPVLIRLQRHSDHHAHGFRPY